jgi:hypothetical protein
MSPTEIKQLVDDLDSVDFREFWWGSRILDRAGEVKSPEVVRILLIRHHGLQNKRADSCHVIREAIKRNDGTDFPTIWKIIDGVSNSDSLISEINDPCSLPWAAAHVLGEIGGRPALSQVTGKLRRTELGWQYFFIRIAMHLLIRYAHVTHPEEPEIEGVDVRTGRTFRKPMRESAPDIYQRTMLRRSQENELFKPVDPAMVPYLLRHISIVDERVLPCDRNQLQQLVKILPTE